MPHAAPTTEDDAPQRETIWLVGQPPLALYVDFVRDKVPGRERVRKLDLVKEWQRANDVYFELAKSEAGLADTIAVAPLPPELRGRARRLRAHPWFVHSFTELPTRFAMVELDKLIVSQIHVASGPHAATAAAIGDDLDRLFDFCFPTDRPLPEVRVERVGEHRWIFRSRSSDLRERSAQLLLGAEAQRLARHGPMVALLTLPIGFGANFMSALRSGKRVVLQNGYHRAVALRRAGFTHAPCIIEEVTRRDELRLGGDDEVNEDPAFYFAAPRPPLLKDFFDERIARAFPTREQETVVEVELVVKTETATRL